MLNRQISEFLFRLASVYFRYFPLQRGKGIILRLLNSKKLSRFQCVTYSKDGRAFWFDSRTRHGYQIFFFGYREWAETELVQKIIRNGDSVMDIGANIGWYTTLFARLVGNNGAVIAVEPIPSTVEVFQKNLIMNNCVNNVRLFQGVCSNYTGDFEIYEFPTLHPGLASGQPIGEYVRTKYRVRATTVDLLMQAYELENTMLMKVDLEGAELQVLQGAVTTLRKGLIESILIEANEERAKAFSYEFRECIELLLDSRAEYKPFRVSQKSGTLIEMNSSQDFKHGDNILVVRQHGEVWKRLQDSAVINE
jgi:FkbM family methyltransferase